MRPVLVDTGPLVAILSLEDEYHSLCANALREMPMPLLTCWPIITEAAWILRRSPQAVRQLLLSINGRFLDILPVAGAESNHIAALMQRYEDIHPQLADITLVYLASREDIRTIFTLDRRDFSIYQGKGRRSFRIVPQME